MFKTLVASTAIAGALAYELKWDFKTKDVQYPDEEHPLADELLNAKAGISFSRSVNSLSTAVNGKVVFDQGCSSSDEYGSDNCNWGYSSLVQADVELGLRRNLTSAARIDADLTLTSIFPLPLRINCALCTDTDEKCTFTIPLLNIPVDLDLPPCPIAADEIIDSFPLEIPDSNPVGLPIGVKGDVVLSDGTERLADLSLDVTIN